MTSLDAMIAARLVIVTGKGGVGKTTVAATIALAGSMAGRRTLLVECEGRDAFSRLFRTAPWGYDEREFRAGLSGVAIDAEHAVYEYLEMFYGLKRVSWVMSRTNALDFVTATAPGLRDLLLVGKLYETERRRRPDGRVAYDLIVVDAPPTGRIVPFLEAPESATEIVRVGPIRRQAGQVVEMLEDPNRTQVVLVTTLEEMPVTETIEAAAALQAAGLFVGPVVANQVVAPILAEGASEPLRRLGVAGFATRARDLGVPLGEDDAAMVLELVESHLARLALQAELRAELVSVAGTAIVELPVLADGAVDERAIEQLAERMKAWT